MWILFEVPRFLKCGHFAIIQSELIYRLTEKTELARRLASISQNRDEVENIVERKTERMRQQYFLIEVNCKKIDKKNIWLQPTTAF